MQKSKKKASLRSFPPVWNGLSMVRFAHIIFLAAETRSSLFFLSSPHPHSFFFSFFIYPPPPPLLPPHLPSPAAPLSKPGVGRRGGEGQLQRSTTYLSGKKKPNLFLCETWTRAGPLFYDAVLPCLASGRGGHRSVCTLSLRFFLFFFCTEYKL